jgi:hypothetical protein
MTYDDGGSSVEVRRISKETNDDGSSSSDVRMELETSCVTLLFQTRIICSGKEGSTLYL